MAAPSDIERNVFALPCRLGGIGVANPMRLSSSECLASVQVTKPLTDLIMQQNAVYSYEAQEAQLLAKPRVTRLYITAAIHILLICGYLGVSVA